MLLDECLPRRLGRSLSGHTVSTVPDAGWAGLKNGELLARVGGAFDAFITVDRNLPAQQNVAGLTFGVVVLRASSNRLESLLPLVPEILTALDTLQPGAVIRIGV